MEYISSRVYRLVEQTQRAQYYYIVPQYNCLIPKCEDSQRILATLLSQNRDFHSPTLISEYPTISHKQKTLFPATKWQTLNVVVHYVKYLHPSDMVPTQPKTITLPNPTISPDDV